MDNLPVLRSIISETVDLICLDPLFNFGNNGKISLAKGTSTAPLSRYLGVA